MIQRCMEKRCSFVAVGSLTGGKIAVGALAGREDTVGTGDQEGRYTEGCTVAGKRRLRAVQYALVGKHHSPRLEVLRMLSVERRKGSHSMKDPSAAKFLKAILILTYAPGLCPMGLCTIPSRGVLPPLPPFAACSAFLALCSASRFFNSAGDSNFGFLDWPP